MSYVFDRKVLDHGHLRSVETWGSEEGIIEAARMSTSKGFLGWGPRCKHCGMEGDLLTTPTELLYRCIRNGDEKHAEHEVEAGDEKLLRYLYENQHATPFEMAGATFEVQAPIFVFREWHRHRVPFGYNEMSARYVPLPDVNYVPTVERLMVGSDGKNKQAGTTAGAKVLTEAWATGFQAALRETYKQQQEIYEWALEHGVPKELARVHLPVGRYSRMRATGNLRGWLGFLALRQAPQAQWEIRQYAEAVHDALAETFPRTLALFDERRP